MAPEWQRVKDDTLLVLAAMAGDLDAFDELVRRYRPAVHAVAYQMTGSWDEAEDATQETFLIALKALPTLREPQKFGAWLHAIARHQALRQANHRQRWELDELLLERWEALREEEAFERLERRERYRKFAKIGGGRRGNCKNGWGEIAKIGGDFCNYVNNITRILQGF
jgi:RNA polymerase sigma-70 factor (ECF subfamily)